MHSPLVVDGIYSDVLFRPAMCAFTPFDPLWTAVDNVDRRSGGSLSVEEFAREYEWDGKPVVITDVVDKWSEL